MILYPKEAFISSYNYKQYQKLSKKFCDICKSDLLLYMSLLEYSLKYNHINNKLIDNDLLKELSIEIYDKSVDKNEAEIFLNSIFMEMARPFLYSKVEDLIYFVSKFPYKKCSDCILNVTV